MKYIDPSVLFDEFYVESNAEFPVHPHRSFEIITYMLEGAFIHRDSIGMEARVEACGIQRKTTGKGIIHFELPGTRDEPWDSSVG